MRMCSKCQKYKLTAEFPASTTRKSGVGSWCLECHRTANRDRYNRNNKRSRPPRRCDPFVKLTEAEWIVRKAATKQRSQINARQAMSQRWHSDPTHRESRRAYMNDRRAEERRSRVAEQLQLDLERIQTEGVRRKRSHHKICPVLRSYPDLYLSATKELKKLSASRRDPQALRAKVRQWKKANPAKVSIQRYRRRVNLQNCITDLTEDQWSFIKAAYRHRCGYCHERKPLTQDHIVPVSCGGDHTASNIIPACRSCNSRKNARLPIVSYQPHLIA